MKKLIFTLLIVISTTSIFAADGDLDLSFNGTGLVTVGYGIGGLGTSSAIQPDGKILVGYTIVRADNNADAVVYRYNANGSLDATFGTNGLVIFDLSGGIESDPKVLLAADGKIVVVFKAQRASPAEIRIALARLNTNGSLDATFGTNGITTSNFVSNGQINNRFSDAVLQTDGKIAVGGQIINNGFAIARWNADGTVDTSFGNFNGYTDPQLLTSTSQLSQAVGVGFTMALQTDGKLVIAGTAQQPFQSTGTSYDLCVVRYNPNGSLDTAFGGGKGFVLNDFNRTAEGIRKIFILPDGKLLAGGYTSSSVAGSPNSHAFARYNADGSLDAAFGSGGKLTLTLPITPVTVNYFSMALQADGKILLAGAITDSTRDYALMRLTGGGAIDTTFGSGGIARFDFVNVLNVTGLNLQPDGKIIAIGRVGLAGNGRTARFNNSSAQTPVNNPALRIADFDGDGKSDASVFRNGTWFVNPSTAPSLSPNSFYGVQFGLATDKLAPADYDGDGKTDIAIWRESEGNFYILNSSNGAVRTENFGLTGDILTVGDYDGDGKADLSTYREGAQSYFFYRGSLNNPSGNITYIPWGTSGDKAVRGDFDGDAKLDAAIYRGANQTWYIRNSSNGQISYATFGLPTDKRISGDFDGDGKTDICVFRDGVWYILQSSNNQIRYQNWGINSDTIAAGDYDGDGKTDVAVWRNGIYYILNSGNSSIGYQYFGATGDQPIASVFVR